MSTYQFTAQLKKLLFASGFVKVRQKGSHVFYRHPDGRYTTIPHHKGRGLLRIMPESILHTMR